MKLSNHIGRIALLGLALASSSALAAQHHEIKVSTSDAATTLAGTLSLPDGVKQPPVVLFINGSGGHLRDQVISGTPMLKEIAEHLLANGIATLRLDDRGAGQSTGPTTDNSTTADRVSDMRAALAWLKQQKQVTPSAIGLLGHSEGAAIAAELAAASSDVNWAILLGAPAQRGQTVWLDQQIAGMRAHFGPDEAKIKESETLLREVTELSMGTGDAAALEAKAIKLFAVAGMDEKQVRESGMLANFVERMGSPWMRHFLKHDPAQALRTLRQPVLLVYGSIDELTRPATNAAPLLQALSDAGNGDISLRILPQQDHFFLRGEGLAPGQHEFEKMHVAPELKALLAAWIAERPAAAQAATRAPAPAAK